MTLIRTILLLLLGIFAAPAFSETAPPARGVFHETPLPQLGRIPHDAVQVDLSPDATLAIAVVGREGRWHVVANGQESPAYDEVRWPAYSKDGKHLAYAVRQVDKWSVVLDGKAGPHFDRVEPPVLSSAGDVLTYVAERGGKQHVVVNQQLGAAYENIGWYDFITLEPKAAAMVKSGGKWSVIVGNRMQPGFDYIREDSFRLSREGNRIAYIANSGGSLTAPGNDGPRTAATPRWNGGQWFVVVDGKPGARFDEVRATRLWSADGAHIAYAARRGDRWFIVADDKEYGPYTSVAAPVHSSDGKRLAYAARTGDRWQAIVDGVAGAAYDAIVRWPVFTNDGATVAYVAHRAAEEFVVVNEKPMPSYDQVMAPVFSEDGKRLAYPARTGQEWRVVIDGVKSDAYEAVRNLTFSTDGKRFGFIGRRAGKDFAVIDGVESPGWDTVRNIVFTRDGAHVAYVALRQGKEHFVLDGQPGAPFDTEPIAAATFDKGGWMVLSADKSRVFYLGHRGASQFVVADGVASSAYSQVWFAQSPGQNDAFYTFRDGAFYRVVISAPVAPAP